MKSDFAMLALVHFFGVISPGQDFIGISRFALKNKAFQVFKFALGIAAGQAIYIFLSVFGVIKIILQVAILYKIFCIFSAGYLLYLSTIMLKNWKIDKNFSIEGDAAKNSPILMGFLLTISNPKAPIFYSSILADFITPGSGNFYMLFICAYMSVTTCAYFFGIAYIFTVFREKIWRYFFWLEKIFALFLLYFGFKLLLEVYKV